MQRNVWKAGAFVMMELAFVIAILAILAALLFPLFARSLEQARIVPCMGNCAQLGMALQMYMHDYDETLPTMNCEAARRVHDDWGEGYGGHWTLTTAARRDYVRTAGIGAQLLSYTRGQTRAFERLMKARTGAMPAPDAEAWNLWVCPMDGGAKADGTLGHRWSSYHYRYFLYCGLAEGFRETPEMRNRVWHDASLEYPAQTYVFSELWPWHDDRREALDWLPKDAPQGWSTEARIHLSFLDGHTRLTRVDRCLLRASWWPGQGYDYHWLRMATGKDCRD